MTFGRPLLLAAALLLQLVAGASAEEAPAVVNVCVACHGEDGSAPVLDQVPVIAGIPASHIEEAIYSYQDGARRCIDVPAMCEAVSPLSEDEVADAAEYYAAQQRVNSGEPYSEQLASKGKDLHEQYCSKCHARPDDPGAADALGIPLHGQRSAYLRHAFASYFNGTRDTLLPAMEEELRKLTPDDIEALINYYASYEP